MNEGKLGQWLMLGAAAFAVFLAGVVLTLVLYAIYSGLAGLWDIEPHEEMPACAGQTAEGCPNPYAPDLER